MNYQDKYIKYKTKYDNLKNIYGGSPDFFYPLDTYMVTHSYFQIISELSEEQKKRLLAELHEKILQNSTINLKYIKNKLYFNLLYFKFRTLNIFQSPHNIEKINKLFDLICQIIEAELDKFLLLDYTSLDKRYILNLFVNQFKIKYIEIGKIIKSIIDQILISEKKKFSDISWRNFNFTNDGKNVLYILREAVVFFTLAITNSLFYFLKYLNILNCNPCPIPEIFLESRLYNQHTNTDFVFVISKSSEITSDIVVNIRAQFNTQFVLSVLEDFLELLPWFNCNEWHVDFYGDIKYIYSICKQHIHVSQKLTPDDCTKLITFAYLSCNKHYNYESFIIKIYNLIKYLMIIFKIKIKGTLEDIKTTVENELKNFKRMKENYKKYRLVRVNLVDLKLVDIDKGLENLGQEYRSHYYTALGIVDKTTTNYFKHKESFASFVKKDLIYSLAECNKYRDENYILPDTVVHVVACPFKDEKLDKGSPIEYQCSELNKMSYICSIIEQYGFMLSSLYLKDSNFDLCNMQANKYFFRIIDGLLHLCEICKHDPLTLSNNFNKLFNQLNKLRSVSYNLLELQKERDINKNANKDCLIKSETIPISLESELYALLNTFCFSLKCKSILR